MNIAIIGRDHYYVKQLTLELLKDEKVDKILVIGKDISIPVNEKIVYIDTLPYFPLTTIFAENNIKTVINFVKIDDETYSSKEAYNLTLQSLQNILYSGAKANVENYLLYSSTIVYGVNKKNNNLFMPTKLTKAGSKFYYSKLRFEAEKIIYDFMDEFAHFNVKILRTAFTLGKNVDNLISSYLSLKFLPQIKSYNPEFECIHEDDVVDAFHHLIFNGEKGIYNLSSDDSMSLKEIAYIMDHRLISINKFVAKQIAFFSWLLIPNILRIPPNALEFFMYPFLTDNSSLKKTGFKFKHTLEETIKEFKNKNKN